MSAAEPDEGPVDEFDWIDRCLRPLAKDAPEALDLLDDAALIPQRPGFDLVVSADAIVEGVHFRPDDPPDLIARKLLRVNLSDLAAKGAEPYAYVMTVAWPQRFGWAERRAFAEGLRVDQTEFGLRLLGGDTTSTPGPLSAGVTIFGWVPAGALVRRAGARAGDVVLVSGTVGDGWLGLSACDSDLGLSGADTDALAHRYRLPQPRTGLAKALRRHAHAGADVSDGLIADAGRIARASGLRLDLDLDRLPLSSPAQAWLARQPDPVAARLDLASGGDDYEVVCTTPSEAVDAMIAAARGAGVAMTTIGRVLDGDGVGVLVGGVERQPARAGYRHR